MSSTLTPTQQIHIARARALASPSLAGPRLIAEYLGTVTSTTHMANDDPVMVYAEAFGRAQETIAGLLDVIADLTEDAS